MPGGWFAPGGFRSGESDRTSPFTAAVGMVARRQGAPPPRRSDSKPSTAPGFSELHRLVIDIAYLSDRRRAFARNVTHLTRRQADEHPLALFCQELGRCAGAPHHL